MPNFDERYDFHKSRSCHWLPRWCAVMIFTNHEDVIGYRVGVRIETFQAYPLDEGLLLLAEYLADPSRVSQIQEQNRAALKVGERLDLWDKGKSYESHLKHLRFIFQQLDVREDLDDIHTEVVFYLYATTGTTLEPGDQSASSFHWIPSSAEEFRQLFDIGKY